MRPHSSGAQEHLAAVPGSTGTKGMRQLQGRQLLQGHSGLREGRKQYKGTAPTTAASPETDPRLPLAVDFHSLTHELGQRC